MSRTAREHAKKVYEDLCFKPPEQWEEVLIEAIGTARIEGAIAQNSKNEIAPVLDACEEAFQRIVASDPGPAYHIAKTVLDEYFPKDKK